jgi:hypothetical protein
MKIINERPAPQRQCNGPGGCENDGKHMVTIQPDAGPSYKSYFLCDDHLTRLKGAATNG